MSCKFFKKQQQQKKLMHLVLISKQKSNYYFLFPLRKLSYLQHARFARPGPQEPLCFHYYKHHNCKSLLWNIPPFLLNFPQLRKRRRRRGGGETEGGVGGLSFEHVACLQITTTETQRAGVRLAPCRFPPLQRRWGWCWWWWSSTSERLPVQSAPHSRSRRSRRSSLPPLLLLPFLLPRCCVKRLTDPHTAGRRQHSQIRIQIEPLQGEKNPPKPGAYRTEPNREGRHLRWKRGGKSFNYETSFCF